MTYYIIKLAKTGETIATAYDTQDLIKCQCDLVNGCGVNLEDIEIITVENGKQTRTGVIK